MKLEIEEKDLDSIASRVLSRLKPLLKATEIDTIMTIGDLASYLKVKESWIYERTHRNEIPFYKQGNKLFFRKNDIDSWLKEGFFPCIKKRLD